CCSKEPVFRHSCTLAWPKRRAGGSRLMPGWRAAARWSPDEMCANSTPRWRFGTIEVAEVNLQQQACRVGRDPIDLVYLIENHDEAYHIWSEAGLRHRILVHIDAHHDMWWIDDTGSLTIASYICPALK